MTVKRRLKAILKTAPGKVAAALLTALVGVGVTYFVPGLLDSLTGKDKLQISLQTNAAEIDTFSDLSRTVVVPFDEAATGSPGPGCIGFLPWATEVGGVRASRTDMRLVVQGGSEEIYIGGMRARVLARSRPLEGTAFQCPTAGAAEVRTVVIDLDQPGPEAPGVWVVGDVERSISFTVAPEETEVFDITVHTEECLCKWVLELVTTQGGEEEIVEVDDHGAPFETTSWAGSPTWESSLPSDQRLSYYAWDWEEAWTRTSAGEYEPDAIFRPEEGPPPPLPVSGEPE
jgi:hypothetical protein